MKPKKKSSLIINLCKKKNQLHVQALKKAICFLNNNIYE